jgi:hypothetical protein
VEAVLARLHREIEQVPPIYSALKVEGRRAYDLARSGEGGGDGGEASDDPRSFRSAGALDFDRGERGFG